MFALAVPTIAHAGPDEKGFRVGANYFGVEQKDEQQATFPGAHGAPGASFGAFVTLRGSANVALQLEGTLTDKNVFTENCMGSVGGDTCVPVADLSLVFFEIPILLRVDLLPARTKFHFDLGPELVLSLGGTQTDAMTKAETRLDLTPANIGVLVGAGFEFGAGPGSITFDVRYQRWGAPVTNAAQEGQRLKSASQVVIEVGYAFP